MKKRKIELDQYAFIASSSSSSSYSMPPTPTAKPLPKPDAVQLTAISAVLKDRKCVFITGPAGTGKSFTVGHIVRKLRDNDVNVRIASTTGSSAVAMELGATTVHRLFGLGDVGKSSVSYYIDKLRSGPFTTIREALRALEVLVIDEISMMDSVFLDKLDSILRRVRSRGLETWGGIQVVFVGDFAQLKPIGEGLKRAFHSKAWRDANVFICRLDTLHRQERDTSYGALLNRARFGRLTDDDVKQLKSRVVRLTDEVVNNDDTVFLFSRNVDVDAFNVERLSKLDKSTTKLFECETCVNSLNSEDSDADDAPLPIRRKANSWMKKNMRAAPLIELRIGAKVMLLANIDTDNGLANGSIGIVNGYASQTNHPIVRFTNGIVREITPWGWQFKDDPEWTGRYSQYPLMLAYAISTHKSQGLTLARVVVDMSASEIFQAGMGYVILSRVRSIDSLFLKQFHRASVYTNKEVREFYSENRGTGGSKVNGGN